MISSNAGNGVNITGADALGNTVANNIIGLTAAGSAVLGNNQAGVADTAPGTTIGPGNVISANLIGVSISGATATGVTVDRQPDRHRFDRREPTWATPRQGVEIESASGRSRSRATARARRSSRATWWASRSTESTSTQNLVEGNFIGIDKAGTADRGNSNEGVLIEGASGNTVGGTTARGPQRDLGQPVGNPARRLDGDGQPHRRERHRNR